MESIGSLNSSVQDAVRRKLVDEVRGAGHTTVSSYFHALAAAIPERAAVTRLVDGETEGRSLTFGEMDRRARSLAAYFQGHGAQGTCAMMLLEGGPEVMECFLGCAYGSVISVPMPAPLSGKVERYLNRIKNVILDCDIRFILTTSGILNRLRAVADEIDGLSGVEWIAVDTLTDLSEAWIAPEQSADDIAYLQYTSGSTSTPKGVMITHHNLIKILEYNGVGTGCSTVGTQSVTWLPYFHDFGLIEGLLLPLAFGMSVYAMTPFDFVKHPVRWVNAIDRYRASHSSGPSFAFDLLARKTTEEQRSVLDLGCWKRANNAAEPIRSSSIERFLEAYVPSGFAREAMAPAWGLAEATLMITLAETGPRYYSLDADALRRDIVREARSGEPSIQMVGCGRVARGTSCKVDVRVVNPDTFELSPPGVIGEVWVSGELLAKGYWKRPEDTEEKFHAQIKDLPGERHLRTGDLGFMDGDELVFTGRRKDLIVVEGRNHYPQEIEKTAEASHPALRPGATIAFSVDTDDLPRLVVVSELSDDYFGGEAFDTASGTLSALRRELERSIRSEVAEEHQIRVHDIVFISTGSIAKTTSGKLQRSVCREQYVNRSLSEVLIS